MYEILETGLELRSFKDIHRAADVVMTGQTLGASPDMESGVSQEQSILDLVLGSGIIVQLVLLILLSMSFITWGIVVGKWLTFRKAKQESKQFSDIFWAGDNIAQISKRSQELKASPVAAVFCAAYKELSHVLRADKEKHRDQDLRSGEKELQRVDGFENIDRALKRAKAEELTKLEEGTTFLATTASAAPFIGLFGTVWGIMNAFIGLSHAKSSSIQAVAPGISEALIATAIGLAAAIPAAVAYNYFAQQVRVMSRSMDMFAAEFLNIARRHFLR